MTDLNYPPSATYRLGDALEDCEARGDQAFADALSWAVDEWGPDAEVTLTALTTGDRDRVFGALNQRVAGEVTESKAQTWLTAAGVEAAPWLESDMDVVERGRLQERLPPALTDWLRREQEGLNDLGGTDEGN